MRLQTKTWPLPSTDQYALPQDCVAGKSLILEGTSQGALPSLNYGARTVTLTSPNDLSGINFTINGFYYGQPASATTAGPNNETIEVINLLTPPVFYFDSIVSIVPDTTLVGAEISAGTGYHGNLDPFLISAALSVVNLSFSYQISGQLKFNQYVSLYKPNQEYPGTGVNEIHFRDIDGVMGITASGSSSLSQFPVQMLFVEIVDFDATPTPSTGSLAFEVLQSGISDS